MKNIFQRKKKSQAVVAAVDTTTSSSNNSLFLGLSAVLPTGERAKIPSTTTTRRRTFGSNTTRTTPQLMNYHKHHTVQRPTQKAGAVTAEDTSSSFDCISTTAVSSIFERSDVAIGIPLPPPPTTTTESSSSSSSSDHDFEETYNFQKTNNYKHQQQKPTNERTRISSIDPKIFCLSK